MALDAGSRDPPATIAVLFTSAWLQLGLLGVAVQGTKLSCGTAMAVEVMDGFPFLVPAFKLAGNTCGDWAGRGYLLITDAAQSPGQPRTMEVAGRGGGEWEGGSS